MTEYYWDGRTIVRGRGSLFVHFHLQWCFCREIVVVRVDGNDDSHFCVPQQQVQRTTPDDPNTSDQAAIFDQRHGTTSIPACCIEVLEESIQLRESHVTAPK